MTTIFEEDPMTEEEESQAENGSASWVELRKGVRLAWKRLSSRNSTPSAFRFREMDGDRTRLYFLTYPNIGYVDIGDSDRVLSWNYLVEPSFQAFTSTSGQLSKEELLLSERKRCTTWGIKSFEMDETTGKIIFPASSSLFGCVDNGQPSSNSPLYPYEIKMQKAQGAILNSVMCPANPDLIASVINGDIWISHAVSGDEVRATFCHHGHESLADDSLSCGLPAYVTQEEFERFTGFWWRPICEDGEYQILYEVVDEGDVELMRFPAGGCRIEEFRFPRAGTINARSILKLLKFRLRNDEEIVDIRQFELEVGLDSLFPWMEYLIRVGWMPDGHNIWVQILNRKQSLIELVMLPQKSFVPVQGDVDNLTLSNGTSSHRPPAQVQVLCSIRSETWIVVNDILTFLPPLSEEKEESSSILRFIWATEENGWRHLYLYTVNTYPSPSIPDALTETCLRPPIISKVALTTGKWSVINRPITVDNDRGLVYFHAVKDTPLEKHLYVVSMSQPGHVRRLTTLGYSHNAHVNRGCTMFVTLFSSIHSVPGCQLLRLGHKDSTVDGITLTPSGWLLEPRAPDKDYCAPEFFNHTIYTGEILYGMMFKPKKMVPGRKYPIVLSVYGGPEIQLVSNAYKGKYPLRNQLLTSRGYGVICVDSRGSQNRGTAMESHIRHRMGQVEMADQVEVLKAIAKRETWIDMSRVAIIGWSYGGYLSLMGLANYPEIFKVAIAGAPVTSWHAYDTGYTERYMNLPSLNPTGYSLGSVLNYVNKFPDEPNRLLILHGLMDENVHFYQHTAQLIASLVKQGKPHQIQIYPGERHSLRCSEANEHCETTVLSFLHSNL